MGVIFGVISILLNIENCVVFGIRGISRAEFLFIGTPEYIIYGLQLDYYFCLLN